MPKPINLKLYEQVKKEMKEKYEAPRSPFLSGAIVAEYKKRGGKYTTDNKERKLDRWFKEKWVNVNPVVDMFDDKAYAFFRPTVQVSEKTPILAQEISKTNLKKLVKKKQSKKYGKNVEEEIIGGMIVQSQPFSKGRFTNFK